MRKPKENYTGIRVDRTTHALLTELAKSDNVSLLAELRETVAAKHKRKFGKRIICVQHDGGRVEVDPSAK